MAKVSVLMAVYNEQEAVLRQSIESILNQTYTDFEFVIIGDNPSNKTLNFIVREYALIDKRIVFHINSENIGLTKSLNRGIKLCNGNYIARMDADDISFSTRLEKQVAFMENHPYIHVLNTSIKKFYHDDLDNNILMTVPYDNESIVERLFVGNILFHPTIMIRKSFLDEFHISYNEMFRRSQDYAFWLDLASHGAIFASLPEPFLYYRSSENQISIKFRSEQQRDAEAILIYYIRRTLNIFLNEDMSSSSEFLIRSYAKKIQQERITVYNKELLYKMLLSCDDFSKLIVLLVSRDIQRIHFPVKKMCKIVLSCFTTRWDNEKINWNNLI